MLPDLVIKGALVIDGTGRKGFPADVVINHGTIVALADVGTADASETLRVDGMVLCPGFIDSHTHDDQLVLQPTRPHPKLLQGVCTVVTGNCGISLAPEVVGKLPAPLDILARGRVTYSKFGEYIAELDATDLRLNVVPLVGHINLRVKHVADLKRAATAEEIQAMYGEARDALDSGAFGISTGVYYPPAMAADLGELVGVCAALRGRDALLAMHLRDEGDEVENALTEAFNVAKTSEARLIVSHHKVVGPQNHGRTRQTLAMIEKASRIQPVCVDCYPYAASSTMLSAKKAALIEDVLITWSAPHPGMSGRYLKEISSDWSVDLEEAARRLMPGGAIYFSMAEDDVDRVLAHPLTMIGSDGLPHDERPHPRLWGSFPRVLGHYSRDRGILSLEQAVHKMTGLPAKQLGLGKRGVIAPGNAADIVIFDPVKVTDRATYQSPHAAPEGIRGVFVNGRLAVWDGVESFITAGQRLKP